MKIKSPVTYSFNTSLIEQFSATEIIRLYQKEGIEVKRFFENLEIVDLYQCQDSGYRFFHPFSIFGDNLFYQDLQVKIPGYYHTNRWEHQKTKGILQGGNSLLEIGCGDGVFLENISKICNRVKGLELNTQAVSIAQMKGLDVEEKPIQEFAELIKEKFDVVCTFQVLEHIADINSFLNGLIKCTKPQGFLIIAVPNNNPYLFKREKKHFLNLPPHHAGLWNEASLRNLCNIFPISVENIFFEPLIELKMWYKAQMHYFEEKKPWLGKILKLVPRQLYKPVLKLFRKKIQGKTVLVVYKVK